MAVGGASTAAAYVIVGAAQGGGRGTVPSKHVRRKHTRLLRVVKLIPAAVIHTLSPHKRGPIPLTFPAPLWLATANGGKDEVHWRVCVCRRSAWGHVRLTMCYTGNYQYQITATYSVVNSSV